MQQTLLGEWRLNTLVSESGRCEIYLIHRPVQGSNFGAHLVTRSAIYLSDVELIDTDWASMIERAAIQAGNAP